MSVAKIMGLLYGCMGLIFVPFFLIIGLVGSFAGHDKAMPFAGIFGVFFAILMPVLYGAMGFVFGALGALLYNVLAKYAGGFELELQAQPGVPSRRIRLFPLPGRASKVEERASLRLIKP